MIQDELVHRVSRSLYHRTVIPVVRDLPAGLRQEASPERMLLALQSHMMSVVVSATLFRGRSYRRLAKPSSQRRQPRPDTVRRYAAEAGFNGVDVLPIEHDFWRFYRLVP